MKKQWVLLIMSVCIIMLVGGCKKKNTDSETDYKLSDHVKLGQYMGIEIKADDLKVTDEDVDAKVTSVLTEAGILSEVTGRAVANGDVVNIDYEGLLDGVAFEGGTAAGADLTIGSGTFIPGFEEQLVGTNIGDKLDVDVTFPTEYSNNPDLAGKAVTFKVTVNSISKAELTVDYVKENTDFETIEDYKASVRTELETAMTGNKQYMVWDAIVKNAEIISVPQSVLDAKVAEMTDYVTQSAVANGMEFSEYLTQNQTTQEEFTTQANDYAKEAGGQELVLQAIVKAEKLEITDEEFNAGVTKFMVGSEYDTAEKFIKNYGEATIKSSLLWDKVMKYVTAASKEI